MSDPNPLGRPKRAPRYWQTSDFWKDAGERIVTAFLEGCLALIGVDWIVSALGASMPTEWWIPPLAGGLAAAVSTIKAIVGARRKDTTTPVSLI